MAESCLSLRDWYFGTLGSVTLSADNPLTGNAKPGARHDYYERQKYLFAMAFVVVSIVPLLVLNYNASRFYQDSWIDNTSRELATLAVDRKEIIDRFLTTQENLLSGFLSLYTPLTLVDDKKLASLFKAVNYGGVFTDLGVIDVKGNHLAYHGPFAKELVGKNFAATEWFAEVMKSGRFVGDVTSSHRREPHLTVAVANVGRSWILWSTIDLGKIHDLVKTAGVGPEGDVFIINRRGELQTPSRLDRTGVTSDELMLFHTLADNDGATRHDRDRIVSATYLNGGQWLLVLENNMKSSLASYYEARRLDTVRLAIATAVIILVAIVLTYSMVGRLSRAERERSMLTSQVGEVEKMALIGRLAASVAHEINNPLQLISGQAGLISDLLEDEDPGKVRHLNDYRKAAEKIRTQIGRAGTITHRLLGFSRAADGSFVDVDVNHAVEETVSLFEHEARRHRIVLVRHYQEDLPKVPNDPAQLQQVVLNVLHNAMDAIGQDGTIEVSSRLLHDRIIVDFADTGPGLTPEVMDHLYDPFFTTKPKGKGTGLGMFISHDIMMRLGGELVASNRAGGGAIFSLRLPLYKADDEELARLAFS
jgi:two-component system NtrC family sensor kinase